MSNVREPMPRSTMTIQQQRRIGALQAAKALLVGTGYQTPAPETGELLRLARFIEDSSG